MAILLAAYAIAAVAVSTYVSWLVVGTSRLSRRLRHLQLLADTNPHDLPAKQVA